MPRSGLQRPLVIAQPAQKSDLCGGHQRPLQIFGPLSEGWPHPRKCIGAQIRPLEAASGRATKGVINEASPLSRLILCVGAKTTISSNYCDLQSTFRQNTKHNKELIMFQVLYPRHSLDWQCTRTNIEIPLNTTNTTKQVSNTLFYIFKLTVILVWI